MHHSEGACLLSTPLARPPAQCSAFIVTQQTRQNDVAKPFFSLFDFFFFLSVKNILWHFLFFTKCFCFFCVVYWNNTALCQKGKKSVGILGLTFYLST